MEDNEFKITVVRELTEIKAQGNNTHTQLKNHLKHHWAVTMAILVAFLGTMLKLMWS